MDTNLWKLTVENKLDALVFRHALFKVGIDVTENVGGARASQCKRLTNAHAAQRNAEDLKTLIITFLCNCIWDFKISIKHNNIYSRLFHYKYTYLATISPVPTSTNDAGHQLVTIIVAQFLEYSGRSFHQRRLFQLDSEHSIWIS